MVKTTRAIRKKLIMKNDNPFGNGRISDISEALKVKYKTSSIKNLSTKQKLDALCEVLQFNYNQLDELIANNSQVLRTIKGHAFEVVFDNLLTKNGIEVIEIGGDKHIDRIVNGKTLQLKTPHLAGTRENKVQYKTHKTHGPKSEIESFEYYHSVQEFPDFLAGLISYDTLQILFLSREELPTHPKAPDRIISPFTIEWDRHIGLNAFERIGINNIDLSFSDHLISDTKKELLPLSASRLNLNSGIILDAILNENNFRIWDMAIRGFAREVAFRYFLSAMSVSYYNPMECRTERADKSDIALASRKDNHLKYLQVKGVSLNICKFSGKDSVVTVETQLTRGRVNDHPTQSRLYLLTDFDFLLISIEPCLAFKYQSEVGLKPKFSWQFFSIPSEALEFHPRIRRRLKSHQNFKYLDIQKYIVNKRWIEMWKTNSSHSKQLFLFKQT